MEIPDFIKLHDKYHDDGLEILGVTIDSGTPDVIANFAENWEMNYTVLTDIQGQETQLVTLQYGQATGRPITGVPTTFIIDRDGYIVKMYIGPQSEEVLYRDLKPYI
jgi:peroxiredoxin|tara:strand:- start:471 stop:791 length:321 start_codon:yes stop_codon:yes gene_type:complete